MILTETRHESKTKLLDAALHVIRAKGYSATRIEDICAAAGLTKGSFFHHFDSKEALALAAADYWMEGTSALFASARFHAPADPVDRLLAYVDFRKALLLGDLPDFTCLVGTMVQEVYDTHPALREACNRSIGEHAATLEPDIEAAMRQHGRPNTGVIHDFAVPRHPCRSACHRPGQRLAYLRPAMAAVSGGYCARGDDRAKA